MKAAAPLSQTTSSATHRRGVRGATQRCRACVQRAMPPPHAFISLYDGYAVERNRGWWEATVYARKTGLALALQLLATPGEQMTGASLVLLTALLATALGRPYARDRFNAVELVQVGALTLSAVASLTYALPGAGTLGAVPRETAVAVCVLLVNLAALVYLVVHVRAASREQPSNGQGGMRKRYSALLQKLPAGVRRRLSVTVGAGSDARAASSRRDSQRRESVTAVAAHDSTTSNPLLATATGKPSTPAASTAGPVAPPSHLLLSSHAPGAVRPRKSILLAAPLSLSDSDALEPSEHDAAPSRRLSISHIRSHDTSGTAMSPLRSSRTSIVTSERQASSHSSRAPASASNTGDRASFAAAPVLPLAAASSRMPPD